MPTSARSLVVPEGADCVVHAVSRCVRRAWLCGRDPYNGRDYEHRRDWVRERVRELAGVFAVEVCAYAIMSNHSHLVLWCRPSAAETWGPEEVARRWLRLFGRGGAAEKARQEAELAADARRVAVCRGRLGSVSWFMRCLNERIARRANAEDGCTGRFWEGRFKCQLLEDEGAVLACMAYVDLNPVRAKLADTLEASTFTSVHDRLVARKARAVLAAAEGLAGRRGAGGEQVPTKDGVRTKASMARTTPAQARLLDKARAEAAADSWLCALGGGAGASARPGDFSSVALAVVEVRRGTSRASRAAGGTQMNADAVSPSMSVTVYGTICAVSAKGTTTSLPVTLAPSPAEMVRSATRPSGSPSSC